MRYLINIIHILFVAPLLYLLGTNKFPEEYKKYLVYLAIIIIIYHSYSFYTRISQKKIKILSMEGFGGEFDCAHEDVHCIDIFDSSPGYSRPIINIKQNDIIIWKNIGELEHNITSTDSIESINPDGLFNSGYLKPGQSIAIKFISSGTYYYYCSLNVGWMRGQIIVE
jgi:hypothetical protein